MAPRKKNTAENVAESTIDMDLVASIVSATNSGGFMYVSEAEGKPLLDHRPPLITLNTSMVDGDKVAARATEEATNLIKNSKDNKVDTQVNSNNGMFNIISGAVLPESKRGGRSGAPKLYPFDQLEVGQGFFVAVSEKHPNPVKTLGSAVSAANLRYAIKDGEKQVERAKRGKKNRAVLDDAGNKIMENKTVTVWKFTRKFTIRPVEVGKTYGTFVAPDNGAFISRVQ